MKLFNLFKKKNKIYDFESFYKNYCLKGKCMFDPRTSDCLPSICWHNKKDKFIKQSNEPNQVKE